MRRVVNGFLYDTAKAEELFNHCPNGNPDDFHYMDETLYKTNSGKFFLAGHGGASTKYAEPCDGGMCGGSGIIPLEGEELLIWLEKVGVDPSGIEGLDIPEA